MAKEFLEKLGSFVDATVSDISGIPRLECKHFFSGAALYAEGRICASLSPVGLAMKLPEETRDRLLADEKAVRLRYFPASPVKKDYVLFPNGAAEGLRGYLKESIEYVITLPKPEKRQK